MANSGLNIHILQPSEQTLDHFNKKIIMYKTKTTLVWSYAFTLFFWGIGHVLFGQGSGVLAPIDVFELEYVSDPQVSPDGGWVMYARHFKDIMTDGNLSNLWLAKFDGSENMPLTTGNQRDYSPRWSPDGQKMAYLSDKDGRTQIYLRWMDTGAEAKLTNFRSSPSSLQWSPDGQWLAFTKFVKGKAPSLVDLPAKPAGAKWADSPVYIDGLRYRSDGGGYLPHGFRQLFVVSADGGTPKQVTTGNYNHNGAFTWTPDSKGLLFSANHHEEGLYDPLNTEIHEIAIASGEMKTLTDRKGPDTSPKISPDGQQIAYIGFDDQLQGYQLSRLYTMDRDGRNARLISGEFDRSIGDIQWAKDGQSLFFQYDDEGHTKLGQMTLDGKVTEIANNIGGTSLGRPYASGSYSMADNGHYAYTYSEPSHPADLMVGQVGGSSKLLTNVNADLFQFKTLGAVEEFWYESSFDQRKVQGWICKPPNFDPNKKYPLLLEIHGGPFSNYGWRFSAEVQMYAAAGYVVLYTNPRGSTSYGVEFGNLIHHNYPGQDYDDLMSGVNAVIEKGYIDENQLYITGGSGGGVLTAWTIGNTDRFRAAVVAKPVINWYSFVLHADNIGYYNKYWFPDYPWKMQDHYMERSPISLVGQVTTPTMLLTGEQDYRTPMSETEQYYAALKLQKVDAAMVRIQNSGHGIANKPSNLMAKVSYVLGWFEKYAQP